MRENFPEQLPGDRLSAERLNKLSSSARLANTKWQSSFAQGGEGKSSFFPLFQQRLVIVVDLDGDSSESSSSSSSGSPVQGQVDYDVRPRYFDHDDQTWRTDEDSGPFDLDAREFDVTFAVGDVLTAWWDDQRQSFIPIESAGGGLLLGKPDDTHLINTTGTINLFSGALGAEVANGQVRTGVFNRFGDLGTDDFVYIGKVNGRLEIVAANPCT